MVAHSRQQRRTLPISVRRPVAALRNRVKDHDREITEQLGLAHHRAVTFWGLLTHAAATILAHTILRPGLIQPAQHALGAMLLRLGVASACWSW
ncbi:MAG TPA: hypothetical protein VKG45_09455 [Actinomycetes bacterium]|nr:hypothetical protein [Actinomycetes bacterium]